MAPFDGLLLKPVLAACFCGRWRTCMGRTAADHRRRGFKRRTASRAARSGAEQYASASVRCALKFDGRSTTGFSSPEDVRLGPSRVGLGGTELPQGAEVVAGF